MAKKIKHSDIIQGKLFQPTITEAEKLLVILTNLEKEFKKTLTASKNLASQNPLKGYYNMKNAATEVAKAREAVRGLNDVDKSRKILLDQLKMLNSSRIQQNVELKIQLQEQAKINKRLAQEKLGLVGAYKKESDALNSLRTRYKNVAVEMGVNSKQARILKKELDVLDNKLKKIDASAGQFQRNVGNYIGGIRGAFGNIMAGAGVYLGTQGIMQGLGLGVNFEKQMSKVQAVSGATASEFAALKQQALDLGEATEKTASEVAGLQLELSKLGFSAREIQNMTAAILDLSTATDEDLQASATVVGATLRQFNMDASESVRVTDVMSESFNKSALDLKQFTEGMAYIGPLANTAGISLERTSALLGVLSNNGIDASTAGRSLRDMLADLVKKGMTWDDAMVKINTSTDKLKTAEELFGKTSLTTSIILAANTEEINKMTGALEQSQGATKKAADIMRDNLSGDIDKLKSAFQGLILDGTGALNGSLRELVQWLTANLETLVKLIVVVGSAVGAWKAYNLVLKTTQAIQLALAASNPFGWIKLGVGLLAAGLVSLKLFNKEMSLTEKIEKEVTEAFARESAELKVLEARLKNTTEGTKERNEVIDTLNAKYGDLIGHTLDYTASEKELNDALLKVNDSLKKRVRTEVYYEQLTNATKELVAAEEAYNAAFAKKMELTKQMEKERNKISGKGLAPHIIAEYTDNKFDIESLKDEMDEAQAVVDELSSKIEGMDDKKKTKPITVPIIEETTTGTGGGGGSSRTTDPWDGLAEAKELSQRAMALLDEEGDHYVDYLLERKSAEETYLDWKKRKREEDWELIQAEIDKEQDAAKAWQDYLADLRKQAEDAENKAIENDLKKKQQRAEAMQTIAEKLTDFMKSQSDKRIEAIDKEIEASKNREDSLREMAKLGIEDAKQNLAYEQKIQAEKSLAREKEIKKQKQTEFALAAIRAYSNKVEKGDKNALTSTMTETTILYEFLKNLPAFWEGTGTGTVADSLQKVSPGRDGYLARVDGSEKIFTGDQSAKIGSLDPDTVADLSYMYRTGKLDTAHDTNWQTTEQILKKFDALQNAIEEKPVYLGRDYNASERAIIDTIARKGRIERRHYKTGGIF